MKSFLSDCNCAWRVLNIFSGAADLVGLDLSLTLTQLEKKFSIRAVKLNKPASQLEINCSWILPFEERESLQGRDLRVVHRSQPVGSENLGQQIHFIMEILASSPLQMLLLLQQQKHFVVSEVVAACVLCLLASSMLFVLLSRRSSSSSADEMKNKNFSHETSSKSSSSFLLPPGSLGLPLIGETLEYMKSMSTSNPVFMAQHRIK